MSLNGKKASASLMTLGAPKKSSGEKVYFKGFLRTHHVGTPLMRGHPIREKNINSPFKGTVLK